MNWQALITLLQTATQLIGAIAPGTAATATEIAALEGVAASVISTISAQKGMTIDQVIAGLTYENPDPNQP